MAVDPAEKQRKLGQKWVCHACAAKFYDMHRPEPTCPRCGADQRDDPALKAPKLAKGRKARSKKAEVIPLDVGDDADAVDPPAARASRDASDEDEDFTEDEDLDELEIDDLDLEADEDDLEDEVA